MPTPVSSGITAIIHFTTKIGGVKEKVDSGEKEVHGSQLTVREE